MNKTKGNHNFFSSNRHFYVSTESINHKIQFQNKQINSNKNIHLHKMRTILTTDSMENKENLQTNNVLNNEIENKDELIRYLKNKDQCQQKQIEELIKKVEYFEKYIEIFDRKNLMYKNEDVFETNEKMRKGSIFSNEHLLSTSKNVTFPLIKFKNKDKLNEIKKRKAVNQTKSPFLKEMNIKSEENNEESSNKKSFYIQNINYKQNDEIQVRLNEILYKTRKNFELMKIDN